MTMQTTQSTHPWRAVVRTIFAAVVAFAALAPALYTAATNGDPAEATGVVAGILAVAAAITRILALPGVERFLRRFLPFLAGGTDRDDEPAPTGWGDDGEQPDDSDRR